MTDKKTTMTYHHGLTIFVIFGILLFGALLHSHNIMANERFKAQIIMDDLHHPWGLAFLDDTHLIITERRGTMLHVNLDAGQKATIANVPEVFDRGQGGLFDIAIDPDFSRTQLIFFSFSEPRGNGTAGTALASARLINENGAFSLADVKILFRQNKPTRSGFHFGSRVTFAPDGTVFLTIGDRGEPERSQDKFDHAGKVIRLNKDGSVPEDNPFANGQEALPEIWSLGHRNPQGAAIDPQTGKYWLVEHGARGGDEINRPERGKNYGWPIISYGQHYTGGEIGVGTAAQGLEQPLYYWDPSIAPSGMTFLKGDYFAEWRGDIVIGALKDQMLVRLIREGVQIIGEERLLQNKYGRLRAIAQRPNGELFFITDDSDGYLIKLTN